MSLDLVASELEVLDPGQRTLRELADEANREHALVVETGSSMVEHAIKAGEALTVARERCEPGGWGAWCRTNLDISAMQAGVYMRLARYQDAVRSSGTKTLHEAQRHLVEINAPHLPRGRRPVHGWMDGVMRDLRANGMGYQAIANELGIARWQVYYKLNPERVRRSQRESKERMRAAKRALREAERERAIERAVKKAGAATQEAWAMAERMQDVLAQAQREIEDTEARRALSEAGVHYRKMRDEIVRALGVS